MLNRLARVAFWLIISFVLLVNSVLVLPQEDPVLQAFAASAELCNGICLMGIYPNVTTVSAAKNLLEAHDWVEQVNLIAPGTGHSQMLWQWSGQQPEWINSSADGRITFFWETRGSNEQQLSDIVVQTISIHTRIRMYALVNWYGTPDSSMANLQLDSSRLGYTVAYHLPGSSIQVYATMPCPVDFLTYRDAHAQIIWSIEGAAGMLISPAAMVDYC